MRIQQAKDQIRAALAGLPWYVNSTTIRGLAIVLVSLAARITGRKLGSEVTDSVCDVLTLFGILVAGRGRVQTEVAKNQAVVTAAATGEIPPDVTQAVLKQIGKGDK